jgi:hypothetical protein
MRLVLRSVNNLYFLNPIRNFSTKYHYSHQFPQNYELDTIMLLFHYFYVTHFLLFYIHHEVEWIPFQKVIKILEVPGIQSMISWLV